MSISGVEIVFGVLIGTIMGILVHVLLRLRAIQGDISLLRSTDAEIHGAIEELRGRVTERIITTVELEETLASALAPFNTKLGQQDTMMAELRDLLLKLVSDKGVRSASTTRWCFCAICGSACVAR